MSEFNPNTAADQSHVCPKCKIEFVTRMPKCPICYHREKSADQSRVIEELTAERDKYRDALAEHTSWKPDVGIIPPIPMGHGTCCCCGKCGRDHDECVCTHNEIEQFLARQVKAELEEKEIWDGK